MASSNELELLRLITNAITSIESLRSETQELNAGQVRIENRLGNVENELINVKTEVKVINKKMSNYTDDVAELRARVEILEEKVLTVN